MMTLHERIKELKKQIIELDNQFAKIAGLPEEARWAWGVSCAIQKCISVQVAAGIILKERPPEDIERGLAEMIGASFTQLVASLGPR